MTITTRRTAGTALLVTVGLLLAAGGASSSTSARQTASPPYKIFLSNTLLNNGWRLEMQSIAKNFVAKTAPYNKKVQVPGHQRCQYGGGSDRLDPGDSPEHPAAIVIDANSPTALNPVLNQAIAQGGYRGRV